MAGLLGGILGKLTGKQLSIQEIMNIDEGRKDRASECVVRLTKVYHVLKEESIMDKLRSVFFGKTVLKIYYLVFKFEVTSKTGSTYNVIIQTSPDYDIRGWKNSKCKVYCECKDFQFRSAYLLGKNNTLFLSDRIKIKLGLALTQAPKDKTPTTLLCKHSMAALQYLVNNYQNIMKTI